MNESPLPVFAPGLDPGPSFVDLLRRRRAATTSPGPARRATRARSTITHGTTVVAIRYAGGVVMAGDRRATAGFTIASRRIEKVFPADELLRRRDRRRRRARRWRWCGSSRPSSSTTRRSRASRSRSRARPTSSRSWCGPTCPRRCRASSVVPLFAGFDERRASGPGLQLRRHRRQVRGEPTSRRTARAASTPGTGSRRGWREGIEPRRGRRPRAAVAVRRRRRGRRHRRPRPRARHLPDGRGRSTPPGYRTLADDDVERRAEAQLGGREEGAGL